MSFYRDNILHNGNERNVPAINNAHCSVKMLLGGNVPLWAHIDIPVNLRVVIEDIHTVNSLVFYEVQNLSGERFFVQEKYVNLSNVP